MHAISLRLKHFPKLRPLLRQSYGQQSFGYANDYQRRQHFAEENEKRYNELRTSITTAHKRQHSLTVVEWKSLITKLQENQPPLSYRDRDASLNSLNRSVLNALLSLQPPHDLMQTARNFIEARNMTNDLLVKRYFVQFYTKKAAETQLSSEEQQELLELCNEFITHEMHLLPEMNEIVALGLCAANEWKRSFEVPNLPNSSLNTLMRKALREDEIESALSSLDKYFQMLTNKTMNAFVKYFDRNPKDIPKNVDKLLSSCGLIAQVFDEATTQQFTQILHKHGHHADMTAVNHSGKCSVCGNSLQTVQITEKEFDILKTEFVKNVVNGVDIRHKTSPAEWEAFERTIREKGPFDIVVDGLNVAHLLSNQRNKFSSKKGPPDVYGLMHAVKQLTDEGKRVLVIGKGRMQYWPDIDNINRIATVFLAKNESEDDIFALYAAISSGNNSFILSNDVMREHKIAIGEQFNALFKLWQQDHWYRFTRMKNGQIKLIKPMYTHRAGDFWHLPFKGREGSKSKECNKYETPQNWACIRLKTES